MRIRANKGESSRLKTILGFPTLGTALPQDQQQPAPPREQQGIALIIAMMTVAMMMGFVADMIVSSSVNLEMGAATKNNVKAEYLAKSGLNLSVFLLSTSFGIDLFRNSNQAGPAQAKPIDADDSMWNAFNRLPAFGAEAVEMLGQAQKGEGAPEDPFGLKGIFSEDVRKQMMLFEDSFAIKIKDEASRINLSTCTNERSCPLGLLKALFSCPAEKLFLEKKKVTGEELAYRIYDFISQSGRSSDQSGLGGKDDAYRNYDPPYKARRLPLDSIDELKLIEGWDDDIHAVFAPYLTVYPYIDGSAKSQQINLNTAATELMTCLSPLATKAENYERFALAMNRLKNNGEPIVDDPKKIEEVLQQQFYYQSDENDQLKLPEKLTVRSDTFRVMITAYSGSQKIELIAIVNRIMPKSTQFLRERQDVKRSYRLLYQRMQ